MKVTPLEIQQKKFPVKFRGLDEDAVDSFLELVREQMEELSRENASLREEGSQREKELEDYKETESALRNMLIGMQQMVEEYKNDAKKEVEIIRKEAELQAERVVEEAQRKAVKIHEDIADLKGVRRHFKEELRRLIESHLEMSGVHEDTETEHPANMKMDDDSNEKIKLLTA